MNDDDLKKARGSKYFFLSFLQSTQKCVFQSNLTNDEEKAKKNLSNIDILLDVFVFELFK